MAFLFWFPLQVLAVTLTREFVSVIHTPKEEEDSLV
jgi:hypothetical protein